MVVLKQNSGLMAHELEMICRKQIAFGVFCRERERRHRLQDDDDEYDEEERGSSASSHSYSRSPSPSPPPPVPAANRSGTSGHRRNRW